MSRLTHHNFAVVSADPLILIGENVNLERDAAFIALLERFRDRTVYFFWQNWWSHELDHLFNAAVATLGELQRRFPGHRFLVGCNTLRELELFRAAGVACAFVNFGAFVDEQVFVIDPAATKKYRTILNAGLVPWKRHNLCTELDSLALVFADWHPLPAAEQHYPDTLRAMLPFAFFANQPRAADPYRFMSLQQVCALCNQAQVGLALSAEEGSSRAVVEYLLCGLPVVSTVNLGGRDEFLDPAFSRHVEADPGQVAAAVDQLIRAELSPWAVRAATLRTIEQHRNRFIAVIDALYSQAGKTHSFRFEWNAFLNRLGMLWQSIDQLLESIEEVRRYQDLMSRRIRG